jgi:hypothetical protein
MKHRAVHDVDILDAEPPLAEGDATPGRAGGSLLGGDGLADDGLAGS